jgi:uncharacterized protein (TIGR03032 family)
LDVSDPSSITLHDNTGVFFSILSRLGCSLALSTDASRIILIGTSGEKTTLRAVVLPHLRGLAVQGHYIAVGTADSIAIFKNSPSLAPVAPDAPQTYDAVYSPRVIHFTGRCDFHDMAFVNGVVTAVNTRYSCICTIDGRYSFTPVWKPPFITELLPQDRCHLNGMAIEGARICYVTMLGYSDKPDGWRDTFLDNGGVLMEAATGRIVASGLSMPHSPRVIGGELYCLESGRGHVLKIDPASGERDIVAALPGFLHGFVEHGGVLFVGISKLRQRRPEKPLPIEAAETELMCGVAAIDANTHKLLGTLEVKSGIDELYDLQIIPQVRHADILSIGQWKEHHAIELPNSTLWATEPETFR